MSRWPIRLRLAAWTALIVALALALFGAGTVRELHDDRIADLDRRMELEARALFAALHDERKNPEDHDEVEILLARSGHSLVEILDQNGSLYYRSPALRGLALSSLKHERDRFTAWLGGKKMRVGVFEKRGAQIRIATDLHPVDRDMRELIRAFLLALPIVLLVLAVGCWWIARQALQPIESIVREAEKIGTRHLDQRLPVIHPGDELGRLTLVLNQTFDRLEDGFKEVAQFTSDAAHELRTPLAIMRGELEAEVRSGTYRPEQEKFLLAMLDDNAHLATIVANLLLLSRADSGRLDLRLETVDFSTLLTEAVEDAEILAAPHGIAIEADIPAGIAVTADRARLRQVLLNLFDNAIKYNREGGRVVASLSEEGGFVHLGLANTGPEIPAERQAHIFSRFFRGDPAHTGEVSGQGLGLSICRELIHAQNGQIELVENRSEHVEFRLRLPLTRPGPPRVMTTLSSARVECLDPAPGES